MDIGNGAPEIVTGRTYHIRICYLPLTQLAPGGRDGCVRLWDPRVQDPVLALEPSEGQPARDCWTVAFGTCTHLSVARCEKIE